MTRDGLTASVHGVQPNGLICDTTPELREIDGNAFASSLEVAGHFEKQHKAVLRSIRNLMRECPDEFNGRNFAPVAYQDEKGELRNSYLLSRDAFTLLAMGFTGKQALQWKLKYIEAFNLMERELRGRGKALPVAPVLPELSEEQRRMLDHVPGVTKRAVFKELSTLAKNNPERMGSLEEDLLRALWILAPSEQRMREYEYGEAPLLISFWRCVEKLAESVIRISHSQFPSLLALNLDEVIDLLPENGMKREYDSFMRSRKQLEELLTSGMRYSFIEKDRKVPSKLTGKKITCWFFHDTGLNIQKILGKGESHE